MDGKPWEGRVRNRSCGLLIENNKLLLASVNLPGQSSAFWTPPGGAVQFGESIQETLIREYKEETNVYVQPAYLKYVSEIQTPKIHAIEFYFMCKRLRGTARLGGDPEYKQENQILQALKFISLDKLDEYRIIPEFLQKRLRNDYVNNVKSIAFIPVKED